MGAIRISPDEPLYDPDDPASPPDTRFTEKDPRYQWLCEQSQLAQWSPASLRAMDEPDLIYLSGHRDVEPPGIFTPTRWSKLNYNAVRADAELRRRWQATETSRTIRTAITAAIVAAVVSVGVALLDDDSSEGDQPSTSTTVAVTTTSTAEPSTTTQPSATTAPAP